MPHEDRTQEIRALLLVVGAVLGLVGMLTDRSWLVYTAIGVVSLGGILALVRRWKIKQAERNESTLED